MHMKKLLYSCLVVLLVGCSTTKYYVTSNYNLDSVDNGAPGLNAEVSENTYSDDIIAITLGFGTNAISLELSNLASNSLKVLWDEASYIDQFGSAHRVIHTGTKLVDRDKAQVPSVVPKNSRITDEVVPSDCIEWQSGSKYSSGGWKYSPIAQMYSYQTEEEARRAAKELEPVQLLLPIETAGQRYEYTFKFVSKNPGVTSESELDATKTLWVTAGICTAAIAVELIVLGSMYD